MTEDADTGDHRGLKSGAPETGNTYFFLIFNPKHWFNAARNLTVTRSLLLEIDRCISTL